MGIVIVLMIMHHAFDLPANDDADHDSNSECSDEFPAECA
jgi:hypothetical protein